MRISDWSSDVCSSDLPHWMASQAGRFDAVLVDAPCSATGTWRRNPELRLRVVDFNELARQQRAILAGAAPLVRPVGRLVYATCSLMAAETATVITNFVAHNSRFILPVLASFSTPAIDAPFLRLLPISHGKDG